MNDKHKSEHHHHILPLSTYLYVFTALLILTAVTVWVALALDFGPLNLFVAMIVAGCKASLVALFFMHLKYDNKIYMVTFVGAIIFLAVFIIFILFDTLRRDDIYEIKGEPIIKQVDYNSSETAPPATGSDSVSDTLTVKDTTVSE